MYSDNQEWANKNGCQKLLLLHDEILSVVILSFQWLYSLEAN